MINKKIVAKVLSDNYSKISDVLKYKYGSDPKEVKNKSAQISKLMNRKPNDKSYYTDIHFPKDLSSYLKNVCKKDYSHLYFLSENTFIPIIGENIKGEIRITEDRLVTKFDCGFDLVNHECISELNIHGYKVIKIFKKRSTVDQDSLHKECFCKSDNKYYCGVLKPNADNTYKLLDMSGVVIFDNKNVEWSAKIKHIIVQ